MLPAEEIWGCVAHLARQGEPCVAITIAAARGSVPGQVGAKAVVTAAGLVAGTVGGGRVEAAAIDLAQARLRAKAGGAEMVVWNLQKDVGMTCGGEMSLVFESVSAESAWHVVVFGAGHVGSALVAALAPLACRVDVVDERKDWLERLPEADNVTPHQVLRFEEGVALVKPDSFVVSVTKGHAADRPVLRDVLQKVPEVAFLGVIGSAAKRAVLTRELREDGVGEELLEKLCCPVGLDLGGNDPAEIAISIVAQLLQLRGTS